MEVPSRHRHPDRQPIHLIELYDGNSKTVSREQFAGAASRLNQSWIQIQPWVSNHCKIALIS